MKKWTGFCVLVFLGGASLMASDGIWTGPSNGAWSATANWQSGTVASGAGSVATLSNLAGPIRITNDVSGLTLKGLVAAGGAYTVVGQPLILDGTASGNYGLIVSNGSQTVANAVKINATASQVYVANGAGLSTTGPLDYLGNNTLTKRGDGEWLFSGTFAETNSSAYFYAVGGAFHLTSGAVFTELGGGRLNFCVGYGTSQPGSVVVESGAALNLAAFVMGYDTGANGTVFLNGGTMTANSTDDNQAAQLGRYGDSTLSLSNGAVAVFTRLLNVGCWARGQVNIGGGSQLTAGRLSLGWQQDVNTTMTGPSVINIGDSGALTVSDALIWHASGPASRTNCVTVSGGPSGSGRLVIPASGFRDKNTPSFTRLIVDGGRLELLGLRDTAYGQSLTNYFYGLNQFYIGQAGATVDTSNNTVFVTQKLERDPSVLTDGGLIKRGTGCLTLTGECTYNGETVVAEGTLRFQNSIPTNNVTILPSATLSLADGQFRAFAPPRLTAGEGGESVIELEAGPGGACDSVVLSSKAQLGNVSFRLVGLGGVSSYWLTGDYVIATYAGGDPNVSGWQASSPTGVSVSFEVQSAQKRVVLHVSGAPTGNSVWLKPGSGAWADAANWTTAPANDPGTAVLFGEAPGAAANVSVGAAVTVGSMTFDSPYACTLSGSGITFGADGSGGALNVLQGSHVIAQGVTLPADLAVAVQSGASLTLGGSVAGAGAMAVTGGGTLSVSNGASISVPLTVDGATLGVATTSTLGVPLTLGAGGATLMPAVGKTVTFSGAVNGAGSITKSGTNVVVLSGANTGTGTRTVQNGTLTLTSLTDGGDLVIGEGTLKYTGPNATTDKGLTLRTSDAKLGATFETDADVTFNGNVKTDNGVFIKAGKGAVTFAAVGNNQFGTGLGSDNNYVVINRGAYGESPTQGLRVFQILDGTVIAGVPGQTNTMNSQTVIVGGESTTAAGAETAGHLVINDGVWSSGFITIGRGNGSATTAPTGLVSTVRINGGKVSTWGLWMGQRPSDMATITARPLFEMNDGEFSGAQLFCGSTSGSTSPRLVFNGGFATFTGSSAGDIRLAYDGGVTSETVVAGGTLAVSNVAIRIADNNAAAKGVVRLNAGRLIARGFERLGSGVAELYFNGGVFQPCLSQTLSNLTVAAVQAGGCVADVPAGISLTVLQTLSHDAALGTTADGGVIKLGAGTLVLDGAQTYTGPTLVSEGALYMRGTLAVTNLTLASGTVLALTNGVCETFAPATFAAGGAGGNAVIKLDIAADGSACDTLALPSGAQAALTFRLFKLGTTQLFVRPGRYPVVTFAGSAPDTSAWTVEGMDGTATFEVDASVVYLVIGAAGNSASDVSVWTNVTGGAWADAGNWSSAPAGDAADNVFFGDAITGPATVATGGGATFGYMAVDSANAYTWSGGPLTLGSAESNASVRVTRGSHTINAGLVLPSTPSVQVDGGATLQVNGTITGDGTLAVTGGGKLVLTNGTECGVAVTLDGVTLGTTLSTTFGSPFAIGAGGAIIAPGTGSSLTMASGLAGAGGLTKTGSSVLTLSGGTTFGGELVVRNGTVAMPTEPGETLVIGEGTFKYTGAGATFARGYTVRTTSSSQAATVDTDADITFNGQIRADSGAFIKLGGGTLTYAYAGENVLSAGDNPGTSRVLLNRQTYGDAPTQGYRSFNIYNGTVVLGAAGQTNLFSGSVVVGGESTTNADAETAAHLEINGGVNISDDFLIVGRGNGSSITAPTGLVSSLTINGGENLFPTVRLADKLDDMSTLTARPLFTMNNGVLSTKSFYCGYSGGAPRPKIVINGGMLTVGPDSEMNLANSAGCVTEMEINGGTVVLTNQSLRLAANQSGAQGTLSLNGGRLIANNIYQDVSSGVGIVNFNGGVFQPGATRTLSGLTAATNRVGGAIFDVPEGITFTLAQVLLHDEGLGGAPDGGLVKLGVGTLVLSATNTYTGPTVLSNGALTVAAPVGSALALGALSLGSASGPEVALTLTADRDSFLSGGAVAVSGDLFLGKTAITLLMRETGSAPSTNGVYTVATVTGNISGSVSDLRIANPVFGRGYAFGLSGSELVLTVTTDTENAAVWTHGGSGAWSEGGNWAAAPGAGTAGLAVGFLDAISAPATVTLDDAATAGSLRFDNANGYTLAGNGSLTLDETNGTPAIIAERGVHTVAVPATLTADTEVSAAASAELDLTGAVSGDGKLTKTGDGRVLLSGANTYAGGTELLKGALDVSGDGALGAGPMTVNGGHLAAQGNGTATVANKVMVWQSMTIAAYAPLRLTGDWTASNTVVYTKSSTNELTVAGQMKNASGALTRLDFNDGSLRFASGADVYLRNTTADQTSRNHINFGSPTVTNAVRQMTVESGAKVEVGCMYMGFGSTNTVSVTGGSLSLLGHAWSGYGDALIMGAKGSVTPVVDRLSVSSGGSVTSADGFWFMMGVNNGYTTLDVSGGTVSLGLFSMGTRAEANNNGDSLSDVYVRGGGLLDVRQRWNWMGDQSGTRVNAVYLDAGGTVRLPATFASVTNRINQSRIVFNGGVLKTVGGGLDAEDSSDYLKGLKQAYVGAGGAVIDTVGRPVGFSQRLMTLDGATDGGVTKLGFGTLTLAKPPCVTGLVDVQVGTLRVQPEPSLVCPDDATMRLSFENGVQKDDSPYGRAIGLVGTAANLALIAGVSGTNALHMSGLNMLYANYSDDMANADSYTISAWVRQSAYQSVTQNKTIFGNLLGGNKPHEFLLRIENGAFRMLGTGAANYSYGAFTADVTNALPLNTWVMMTYVVDGLNGFSMYVNGQKRVMKVTLNSAVTYTNAYGAGSQWLLQPPLRTSGRAFMIGTVNQSDSTGFIGDLDDVTIYRRALSAPEIAMLYRAKNPCAKRVRVAAGAVLDLAGGTQEVAEVSGEGLVINGTAVVTGTVNPGDSAERAAGALLSVANLTLGTNMTYRCDWTSAANDLVDVSGVLTANGAGTIDLGLTRSDQMPGAPRYKSFPVMYYQDGVGLTNFSQWKVTGIGRTVASASVSAADGVVSVNLDVPSGTMVFLK